MQLPFEKILFALNADPKEIEAAKQPPPPKPLPKPVMVSVHTQAAGDVKTSLWRVARRKAAIEVPFALHRHFGFPVCLRNNLYTYVHTHIHTHTYVLSWQALTMLERKSRAAHTVIQSVKCVEEELHKQMEAAQVYRCMHVCTCVCMYAYTPVCVLPNGSRTGTFVYICMYMYEYIHTYVHTFIYIYIYIHTCTHTHICLCVA
jgi:hypothetical protein